MTLLTGQKGPERWREAFIRLLYALATWLERDKGDNWAFQPGLEPNLGRLAMDVQTFWDKGHSTDDLVLYLPMASLRPTFRHGGMWVTDFGRVDLRVEKDMIPGTYRLELKGSDAS